MTLPMRYSVQKSNISPPDFTGEYGRMQVDYRPELEAIVIPASDYDKITTAIAEGRLIGLHDSKGRVLGQFTSSLAGGFDISTFSKAVDADVRVSFRPTQQLIKSARTKVSFEQVPTVANDPQIKDTFFTYDVKGVQTKIVKKIAIGESGLARMVGINFAKGNIVVSVQQKDMSNVITDVVLPVPVRTGQKYVECLLTATTLSTLIVSSDPNVAWTAIKISLIDNPLREDRKLITLL